MYSIPPDTALDTGASAMGQYDRQAQSQPKHGKPSSSGASKAGVPLPVHRPEWRGSGYVKKRNPRQQPIVTKTVPVAQEHILPVEIQQLVLTCFQRAFPASRDFDALKPTLQSINEALSQQDSDTAFHDQHAREAYSLRWSPSRSLVYANVLGWLFRCFPENEVVTRFMSRSSPCATTAICLGASAAEMMALLALLRTLHPDTAGLPLQEDDSRSLEHASLPAILRLCLVDRTDWSSVVRKLHDSVTTRPELSRYASAAAHASNRAMLSSQCFDLRFVCNDVLDPASDTFPGEDFLEPVLVCLFHTLHGYYKRSIPRTTAWLRRLEAWAPVGSLLIVIDDAGATVTLDTGEENDSTNYSCPISRLLERTLVSRVSEDDNKQNPSAEWQKLVADEVREHKLDKKLAYPGYLENMKFQCNVYRRV